MRVITSVTAIGLTALSLGITGAGLMAATSGSSKAPPMIIVPREELPRTLQSLDNVKPLLPDLREYIADPLAAQQLGKAMFWDIQVGSQGVACASCHFHAGADIRIKNQVDPAVKAGDATFGARSPAAGSLGPDIELTAADFPLHRLADPSDRESAVLFDTNDVISSAGSLGGDFISSKVSSAPKSKGVFSLVRKAANVRKQLPTNETCTLTYDPQNNPFHAGGLIYRKVEPRQTPTVVNAVFNMRQFWDGRANSHFNGVDPFGPRTFKAQVTAQDPGNPKARSLGTLVLDPSLPKSGVKVRLEQRLIANASLASQAVGPPLSDFEMSCANKTFADLGRKVIALTPLANQRVHDKDSLFSRSKRLIAGKGLSTTYKALIQQAFAPKFWSDTTKVSVTSTGQVVADANGFTQMEHNFALFWGLAIQSYEALLISDDAPFDRTVKGKPNGMSEEARAGQIIFEGRGQCVNCHYGPVMSGATVSSLDKDGPRAVEHMTIGSGSTAFYDNGFYNIGVRPTSEDLGVGATDPYGFDLSYTRQYKWRQLGIDALRAPDAFSPGPCAWVIQYWPCANVPTWSSPGSTERDAVDGAFKVPILRNVGLNPPYFHNGGQASLKDVVRFYNRGGDRRGPLDKDNSGLTVADPFGRINDTNLHPDIGDASPSPGKKNNALGLNETELNYLVAFLLSLTDDRVACHAGVFDHPELPLSMGQKDVAVKGSQAAKDIIRMLPATGVDGLKASGKPCFPNSGDLFTSVNKADPTPLQATFDKILDAPQTSIFTAVANYFLGVDGTNVLSLPTNTPAVTPVNAIVGGTTTTTTNAGGTTTSTATGGGTTTTGTVATGTKGGTAKPTAAASAAAAAAAGVVVPPPPAVPTPKFSTAVANIHGFDQIGFIQSARVDKSACPKLPQQQWGGSVTLNGIEMVVPCNLVVQMPAATYTWAQLFPPSMGGVGTGSSPISLISTGGGSNTPFGPPSMEIRAVGNIVDGTYIAGLIFLSQETLNSGTGVITGFDYAAGVIYVKSGASGQVRLQLNDALGRFSKGQSPDARFNVDDANPTVRAASGYPMCVPRTDPLVAEDPRCPMRNRPLAANGCRTFLKTGYQLPAGVDLAPPVAGQIYCTGFVMGDPVSAKTGEPIATEQAPFAEGDLITFSGTLLSSDGIPTVSAHTVTANVGIFTEPGTLPSYLAIGEFRVSNFTPQQLVNGVVQEIADRIVLEAVTTDILSIVDIYLVDVDPKTGQSKQRWITPGSMTGEVGAVGSNGHLIDGGITTQFRGAVPGRARIRANKAVPGILDSPTRYLRVVARSLCDPANINGNAPLLGSTSQVPCLSRAPIPSGLFAGQYLAPVTDFLLPENVVPGDLPVPNNLWDLGFLANGEGPGTGPLIPQPW